MNNDSDDGDMLDNEAEQSSDGEEGSGSSSDESEEGAYTVYLCTCSVLYINMYLIYMEPTHYCECLCVMFLIFR